MPSTNLFEWPQMPALPPPGDVVLICVATPSSRQAARRELRAVLREVLANWSGICSEELPLRETPRGPEWPDQPAGYSLDISLSYGANEGWIGLRHDGWIGVDVLTIAAIAEANAVAQNYLGPENTAFIQKSPDPALTFAVAWTELEARLKCLKRELTEWSAGQAAWLAQCTCQNLFLANQSVLAVATADTPEL